MELQAFQNVKNQIGPCGICCSSWPSAVLFLGDQDCWVPYVTFP